VRGATASSSRLLGEAFAAIAARLKGVSGAKIAAIAGDLADAEAMLALKDLMAGARLAEPRLPPGRRKLDAPARRLATSSTPPSPASSRPTRCC
jgi:hypothetical protein